MSEREIQIRPGLNEKSNHAMYQDENPQRLAVLAKLSKLAAIFPYYQWPQYTKTHSFWLKGFQWNSHIFQMLSSIFVKVLTKHLHFLHTEVTLISLQKTVRKVSPILVTLTSRSDSISTTTFERMKEKFDGFRQTVIITDNWFVGSLTV